MRRRIECSNAEWQARVDLAACYHVFDHLVGIDLQLRCLVRRIDGSWRD